MRSAVVGLTGLCSLLLAVPTAANAQSRLGIWLLAADGNPQSEFQHLDPAGELYACPDGNNCTLIANPPRAYRPGDTPAGTVFEARLTNGTVHRSRPWQGRVAIASPPSFTGTAASGLAVTPASGATLYAVEYRVAKDAPAFTAPPTRPKPSALVSVSAPARVAERPDDVTVELYAPAVGGSVGQVWCEEDCRVELTVGTAHRTLKVHKRAALTSTGARPGRHQVTVKVDGAEYATGKVRF